MYDPEIPITLEVDMGCYSREFTLDVLQDKPYFGRLSGYLIEQLVCLDCNDLARVTHAIDDFEKGTPRTKQGGEFCMNGLLAGYGHVHVRDADWMATNLALSVGMPHDQQLETTIDKISERIVASSDKAAEKLNSVVEKFECRVSTRATGSWAIYKLGPDGPRYLALHAHTERGSPEEVALRKLLDSIHL